MLSAALVYGNVTRPSVHRNDRAAAAHFADYALTRLLNAPLDSRRYRMTQRNVSRARRNIHIERCIRRHIQAHIARTGANGPHILRRSIAMNVSAARLGVKSAIDA